MIRECISPYIEQIGGFSCQRLWHEKRPCGYRLVPAGDLKLDALYSPKLGGVFAGHIGDVSLKDPSVFETLGEDLLSSAAGKPLILLDEIGGSELLVPAFRTKLYQVLESSCCIGVLKRADKAEFMSRAAGYPGEVAAYNRRLREDLVQRFDARIVAFGSGKELAARLEIKKFLERIF